MYVRISADSVSMDFSLTLFDWSGEKIILAVQGERNTYSQRRCNKLQGRSNYGVYVLGGRTCFVVVRKEFQFLFRIPLGAIRAVRPVVVRVLLSTDGAFNFVSFRFGPRPARRPRSVRGRDARGEDEGKEKKKISSTGKSRLPRRHDGRWKSFLLVVFHTRTRKY